MADAKISEIEKHFAKTGRGGTPVPSWTQRQGDWVTQAAFLCVFFLPGPGHLGGLVTVRCFLVRIMSKVFFGQ